MKKLALFDFDGTITRKDSFLAFIKYSHGALRLYGGLFLLSPALILFKLGIIPNWKAKEMLFSLFYKGWEHKQLQETASRYAREALPSLLRPLAVEQLRSHQEKGHRVIIITATFTEMLRDFCTEDNYELIGTEMALSNGRITGKLGSKNCYGAEKVKRLKAFLNLADYSYIYAYGDSRGDRPLLSLADEEHYRPFRT